MSKWVFKLKTKIDQTTGHAKCPLFYPNPYYWLKIAGALKPHYHPNNAINTNTIQNQSIIKLVNIIKFIWVLPEAFQQSWSQIERKGDFLLKKRDVRSKYFSNEFWDRLFVENNCQEGFSQEGPVESRKDPGKVGRTRGKQEGPGESRKDPGKAGAYWAESAAEMVRLRSPSLEPS
jgi:hypothetical protein